jgi:hypothetical protein
LGRKRVVASREAANRSRPAWKNKKQTTPRFLINELAKLTLCTESKVKSELRKLEKAGLLLFSETDIQFTERALPNAVREIDFLSGSRSAKRPIPIPRPVLRYLAKEGTEATIKATLAYIIRGLTISRNGEISNKGTAKASWIAEAVGLSLRAVRAARSELLALEFISDDEGSKQWKLNRDGAYFTLNLDWKESKTEESREQAITDFAPPIPQISSNFAPPYKDKKTLNRSKNQKTQTSEESGFNSKKIRNLSLKDIKHEDLRRLSKLKILYAQAVQANWLKASEANFQNFVAAAVRATRIEGDSVRIFVTIVRKGLWHHITQAQEDRAREVISKGQKSAEYFNQTRKNSENIKLIYGMISSFGKESSISIKEKQRFVV